MSTLSPEEARRMSVAARNRAAAQIVVVAFDEPDEVAAPLYQIAARLLAPIETRGADAMPLATSAEVDSW